jgi:hypothetical protein
VGVGDHQRHWDTGCAKFGRVSTAAVAGCHLVWREAMKLWGKAQREIRMSEGGKTGNKQAQRTRKDVDGAPLAERDPSTLQSMYLPLYEMAIVKLRVLRERAITKRALGRQERRIMGWEGWSAEAVVAWWQKQSGGGGKGGSGRATKRKAQAIVGNGGVQSWLTGGTTGVQGGGGSSRGGGGKMDWSGGWEKGMKRPRKGGVGGIGGREEGLVGRKRKTIEGAIAEEVEVGSRRDDQKRKADALLARLLLVEERLREVNKQRAAAQQGQQQGAGSNSVMAAAPVPLPPTTIASGLRIRTATNGEEGMIGNQLGLSAGGPVWRITWESGHTQDQNRDRHPRDAHQPASTWTRQPPATAADALPPTTSSRQCTNSQRDNTTRGPPNSNDR